MERSPESGELSEPANEASADISAIVSPQQEVSSAIPHGPNWVLVDGGRAWGPRPQMGPRELADDDQNQARLIDSIEQHRN